MTEPPAGEDAGADRPLRQRVTRHLPDPTTLAMLGLVSLPGFLFEQFAGLQLFALFFLFGFWPFVQALLPSSATPAEADPVGWVGMGGSTREFVLSSLVVQFNPFVVWEGLKQLGGQAAVYGRYLGRLPNPETWESEVQYRLPVEGEWTVVNGSHERRHSHSWGLVTQRYAYDLVVTDDSGATHDGDGTDPEQFHCFGLPVVAPADGTVVATRTGHPDHDRIGWVDLDQRSIVGNYVTIRHADGEYSMLAHLRRGSVTVEPGEEVQAGQRVGACGHSGNSTEPHLHFHLQDRPSFFTGMGLPIRFDDTATATGLDDRWTVHDRAAITAGQRVCDADEVVGGGKHQG
ncbi:M23 family metallopeptidase [Haloarchaeobius baliensis]|uniref:M23 family metallopeptidase n=1 Tax=Haloarchaeobius baliensis TaxID=1670458 RepID=UPI003F881CFC